MRIRGWLVACVLVGACNPDPTFPEPFLPTVVGWTPVDPVVVIGQPAQFEIAIDWGGPFPDGLKWSTTYDWILEGRGGLPIPPDPPMVVRTGDTKQVIGLPTDSYGWVVASGALEVCQDRDDYLNCVQIRLTPSYAKLAGGAAVSVEFPLADVSLLVGEARPMQPYVGADNPFNGLLTSQEAVTYASSDEAVFTVDAQGVLVGIAPGAATLTGIAGDASSSTPVTVTTGTPALPTQPVLVTTAYAGEPLDLTLYNDFSPDTLAIGPDGRPAFVLAPDNAAPSAGGSRTVPLELLRWTGSGLGVERISEFWETVRTPFLDFGLDGHLYAGWLADMGGGITILDRDGDVDAGGWQRRLLPMRPDPTTGADRAFGPHWPDEWSNLEAGTGFATLQSNVIIGTMPAPDGVWIAYGWGANLGEYPDVPLSFASTCVRTLRLAHVTPTSITTEEVDHEFYPADMTCNNSLTGIGEETFLRLAVGPAMDGSDRPTIVATTIGVNLGRTYEFQHVGAGWVITHYDVASNFTWSPGVTGTPAIAGGAWGAMGEGGALWRGNSSILAAGRIGPYGNLSPDSLVGPTFPGVIEPPLDFGFYAVRGGYGQLAAVTRGDPPGVPPQVGIIPRTWLYQVSLPVPAFATDVDTLGTRLSASAITPRYTALVPLSDDARVLIVRPSMVMSGLASGSSTGPGQPFTDGAEITGVSVPTNEQWTAWGDGARVWLAQGAGPVTLSKSTDHAASAAAIAQTVPSGGRAVRAISTSPGVSWLLTAPVGGSQGAQLWRLDDTSGTMTATEKPAGVWPGLSAIGINSDPLYSNVLVGSNSVWVLAWMAVNSTTDRQLVTRHYALDGTLLSEHAFGINPIPLVDKAAITGGGALVLPMFDAPGGVRSVMTSTDAGTSWSISSTIDPIDGSNGFPPLVRLGDGRVALVGTWHQDGGDPELVGFRTTADGATWSAIRWVRPDGGNLQRVWLAAVDADGDLLVHLGDAGTISGFFARTPDDAGLLWNPTKLEGLLVRVVAP